MLKGLFIDLSGVLYDGKAVIPGAVEAVSKAQASGLLTRFLTNTSRITRAQIHADLQQLGFSIHGDQLYTAPDAAKDWLIQHQLRPYCLIHKGLRREFDAIAQDEPNAVLIGDAENDFNYNNLNQAFRLCQHGAPLLGIGYNRYFKLNGKLCLDAGPFVKAIEFAASTDALIMGKPSSEFFQQALDSAQLHAEEVLMIGDDVLGDIEGALNAGLQGCLVRTGKYQQGDENKIYPPCDVVDSIVEAVEIGLTRT